MGRAVLRSRWEWHIMLLLSRGEGRVLLGKSQIMVNGMQVPRDLRNQRTELAGIRIGFQEMTRFGVKEPEMGGSGRLHARSGHGQEGPRQTDQKKRRIPEGILQSPSLLPWSLDRL